MCPWPFWFLRPWQWPRTSSPTYSTPAASNPLRRRAHSTNAQPYEDGWKKQEKTAEKGTREQFERPCKWTHLKWVKRSMRPRGRPFNKSRSAEESSVTSRVEKVYSLNCNLMAGFSSAARQRWRWPACTGKTETRKSSRSPRATFFSPKFCKTLRDRWPISKTYKTNTEKAS